MEVTGEDAMLVNSSQKQKTNNSTKLVEENIEKVIVSLLQKYNTSPQASIEIVTNKSSPSHSTTYEAMKSRGMIGQRRIVVTSFDKNYFNQGVNLFAGLHRTSFNDLDMAIIFDVGLTSHQREFLDNLEKVKVVDYPTEVKDFFDGYLHPKNHSYKCAAIHFAKEYAEDNDCILWLDAGLTPLKPINEIFDVVNREGVFFVDHNDKSSWPFFNFSFVHLYSAELMDATNEELLTPHLCSCIFGYRKNSPFQKLIEEAYRYSQSREISLWPKHIPQREIYQPKLNERNEKLKKFLEKYPLLSRLFSTRQLAKLYPYYGHRLDQSIYAVIAPRYNCKFYPATRYNRSNEASSKASKQNWLSGGEWNQIERSRNNMDNVDEEVVIYHHRGVYNNLDGLRFVRVGDGEKIFVLGNGPSLKGFDFTKLNNAATIGMNAAYRHWEAIGWFPTYYCCMDLVVTESHKNSIYRLIQEQAKNGIKMFFLRENILETYPELVEYSSVFILERHRNSFSLLNLEPITTGSFSTLFSVLLGYKNIYLLGIDCNYVEFIPQAKSLEGTMLEVTENPDDNPNYFFAGYQQKGDRYNIPNPNPGLHFRSWVALQKHITTTSAKIFNCNPSSKLDIFPLVDLEDVLLYETKKDMAIKAACRQIVLERDAANLESALAVLTKEPGYSEEIGIAARKYILRPPDREEKELLESAVKYNGLIWLGWSEYNAGDFQKMKNYLVKSLEFSPYTSVETIVNWVEHFTQFAKEQGCEFNVDKFSDSQEWKSLIEYVLHLNTKS
ncbi:MAG: hypothetical protein F6K17_04405 [Okeania sp. SIO3C4]|nr:hypothetical protein [Okeania sp. SIO3C4]